MILLPFVGVFGYVVARGRGMGAREQQRTADQQREFDDYVRRAAGGGQADQLAKLGELRAHGDISEEEFRRAERRCCAERVQARAGVGPCGYRPVRKELTGGPASV